MNGKVSIWSDVLSGVPQGNVLGPCLLMIYTYKIDDALDWVMTHFTRS